MKPRTWEFCWQSNISPRHCRSSIARLGWLLCRQPREARAAPVATAPMLPTVTTGSSGGWDWSIAGDGPDRGPCSLPAPSEPPLTAELKRRWQMLQEMNCFFLSGAGTPKVWLITAFCTGSIWKGREGTGGLGAMS